MSINIIDEMHIELQSKASLPMEVVMNFISWENIPWANWPDPGPTCDGIDGTLNAIGIVLQQTEEERSQCVRASNLFVMKANLLETKNNLVLILSFVMKDDYALRSVFMLFDCLNGNVTLL